VSPVELSIHDVAVGGAGVGRLEDGRVVFVPGSAPGDTVSVEIVDSKKRHATARVIDVVVASPDRVDPPCEAIARGCGGCDWQHLSVSARAHLFVDMVNSVLRRHAGVPDAEARFGGAVPEWAYRTTLRLGVRDGVVGFRAARTHDIVGIDTCPVGGSAFDDLLTLEWPGVSELTLRQAPSTPEGSGSGQRMAIVSPSVPEGMDLPADVRAVGLDALDAGKRSWMFVHAAGRSWRLSALSFFQSGPAAAELLVDTVRSLLGADLAGATRLLDLYGGIGLFAGSLAADTEGSWTLVESSPSALADARINLADFETKVVASDVNRYRPHDVDVVIADPPRSGLGKRGVRVVAASNAAVVCLVSCDLGSLGRDTELLGEAGYRLTDAVALDLFPQTSHVEVVTRFVKDSSPSV
jgi:23S rRNA (uracil1939-C5)-methyltransferase